MFGTLYFGQTYFAGEVVVYTPTPPTPPVPVTPAVPEVKPMQTSTFSLGGALVQWSIAGYTPPAPVWKAELETLEDESENGLPKKKRPTILEIAENPELAVEWALYEEAMDEEELLLL